MMNNNFPTVKTYSTKWKRSYKLYHEKDGLFDRVQAKTRKDAGHRDNANSDAAEKIDDKQIQQRPASKSSATRQPVQKSLKRIAKLQTLTPSSSRASPRPPSIRSRPPTTTAVSRPPTSIAVSRPPASIAVSRPPTTTAVSIPTHSPQKVLCTEMLLRYRPEHAEKAYCKNDSYIHAWLRGVEEATVGEREGQHSQDSESSIELLRDTQVEHTGLARRNSAASLLKEMMNAFKSSSMEKSSELSVVKELPSLSKHPSAAEKTKAVAGKVSKDKRQTLKKSRIPTPVRRLSHCSSRSVEESVFQPAYSTPTVTRTGERLFSAKTDEESSHTYTYRWTMGSPTTQDDTVAPDTHSRSRSPPGCVGRLTRKRLNSTTKPCAKSLGKVDFSQNLSPILTDGRNTSVTTTKTVTGSLSKFIGRLNHKRLNSTTKTCAKSLGKIDFSQALSPIIKAEAAERRRSAEATPVKLWKRNSPNKENVCALPKKQRHVGSNRKGKMDPKTSTALFISEINNYSLTPDLSSIQAETELVSRAPTCDFRAVEQEAMKEMEENQNPAAAGPVITSTPDSRRGPEPLLLVDLSAVAPPSVGEDELLPLRLSGDVVNSDEIVCASDISLEVDIPDVKAADLPGDVPDSREPHAEVMPPASAPTAMQPTTKPHTKAEQAVMLKPGSARHQNTKTGQQVGPTAKKKRTVSCKPSSCLGRQLSLGTRPSKGVSASLEHSAVSNTKSPKSWRYFPRSSSGSNIMGKPHVATARVEHTHTSQHPLCSLVGVVKNCQRARANGKVKVMSKSSKLMVSIAQAPPDAIMATVRRVTQV
ncbi:uncharacterized protein LOC124125966 isoform X2 [Haliotis rufescens]|uniref:uncharacterized protein LOC124125966 isoform X2 n=1 Tax=Haliotis rufescens TaxID=6454 RepID=UPI001EB0A98F|nr:uncharacterized protein LOC124125966 isoform X2 [Haliotis rufescens]